MFNLIKNKKIDLIKVSICNRNEKSNKTVFNVLTLNFLSRYHKCPIASKKSGTPTSLS
jgi:hypothetical protein